MASETTPLLPAANDDTQNTFPPISSAAEAFPPDPSLFDFQNSYPHSLGGAQPLRAVAFRLLLALHLLVSQDVEDSLSSQRNTTQAVQDLHEHIRRRDNLRRIGLAILGYIPVAITDARHPGVIETIPEDVSVEYILFASFPVDHRTSRRLRVIDLLAHPAVPTTILSDPIISLALVRLWKFGRVEYDPPPSEPPSEVPFYHRISRVYHAAPTPRTVHGLHMTFHLAYLVFLVHLVLYPSPRLVLTRTPGGPVGIRETIVGIYSITHVVFNPRSFSTWPHILILSAFAYSLPASPSPDTVAYSMLLLALCLHIPFVLFPSYPTLFLLLGPAQWLPLSSLFITCVRRYLMPTFMFLLPALAASTVLLSLSLSEVIINMQTMSFASPSPTASRLAFLGLFCTVCFLCLYLSAFALLHSLSAISGEEKVSFRDWNRYGAGIGIEGRRYLVRAILAYSPSRRPYHLAYPPPLNLLSFPLVFLPLLSSRTYKFLWMVIVGPFAFVVAGLWGWGLL